MTCTQLSAQRSCFLAPELLLIVDPTYAVRDDMRVTVQTPLGVAVCGLVAGQVPDDERLVARAREEHVGAARTLVSRAHRVRRLGDALL
jgi:hypothetical protein